MKHANRIPTCPVCGQDGCYRVNGHKTVSAFLPAIPTVRDRMLYCPKCRAKFFEIQQRAMPGVSTYRE